MSDEDHTAFAEMTRFHPTENVANPITPTVIKELHLHDGMFGLETAAMMLTVNVDNIPAIRLYESVGFKKWKMKTA